METKTQTLPAKGGNGNGVVAPGTMQEKNVTDNVLNRIREMEASQGLQLPANYSAANALKSAFLILQKTQTRENKPVLEACTKDSIVNSLLDMVIQGLSPAKKQCYFIPYGKDLTLSTSYFGAVAVAKRTGNIKNIFANCIYEGDVFEYQINLKTGVKEVTKHDQSFENIDINKIKGAYALVIFNDETRPAYLEIMNIGQIRAAWNQGATKGNSGAHKNFSDQMCLKTVISRAAKMFINTSDDSDVLIESVNRTASINALPEAEYNIEPDITGELAQNANKTPLDINAGKSEKQAKTLPPAENNGKDNAASQPKQPQQAEESTIFDRPDF